MAQSRIQSVVAIVVLIPALLCFWLTDASRKAMFFMPKDLEIVGPIEDLIRFDSVDEMPVLSKEDTPKALKLIVVTRHGMYLQHESAARSPSKGNKQNAASKRGANINTGLSPKGEDLMELVGKLLMKRYEAHFQNIAKTTDDIISSTRVNPMLVGLTASDKYINKNSADGIIAGMKKQNEKKCDFLNPRFVTDWGVDSNLLFNPFGDKRTCKKFYQMAKEHLVDSTKEKLEPKKFEKFTVEQVFEQYNEVQEKRLEGIQLPQEIANDDGKRMLNQMKRVAIRRMENLMGINMEYWKYFVSPLFNAIFNWCQFGNEKAKNPHFHVHVTDDQLMIALVWFLQLSPAIQAAFGPPGDSLYYPQAGDSLVLEINDNNMITAYYLRLVGEKKSVVGFKKISLLMFKNFVNKKDNEPAQASQSTPLEPDPSVSIDELEKQVIKTDEWEKYCEGKK